ncbi:hypothetical protein HQ535_07815 [bacterium]|nr:hypothetical protein [bacterium]
MTSIPLADRPAMPAKVSVAAVLWSPSDAAWSIHSASISSPFGVTNPAVTMSVASVSMLTSMSAGAVPARSVWSLPKVTGPVVSRYVL